MRKKKLTKAQRASLLNVIGAKLALWDASTDAEEVLGVEIDTANHSLDTLCSMLRTKEDAEKLSDSSLLDAFGLARSK